MTGWTNSRTRISALAAMMVMVLMSSTHFAASAEYDQWSLGGREFTITSRPPLNPNPDCSGSTNTVTFKPSSDDPLQGTLDIVGEFDGLNVGVCTDSHSPYAIPPGSSITYAIYGDIILVEFPDLGRIPSMAKIVPQQDRLYFIGLSTAHYVSELTANEPAPGLSLKASGVNMLL